MLLWVLGSSQRKHQRFTGCHCELNLTPRSLQIYFLGRGWGKSAVRQWWQALSLQFPCFLSHLDVLFINKHLIEKLDTPFQHVLRHEPSALKPVLFRELCYPTGSWWLCITVALSLWGLRVACWSPVWPLSVQWESVRSVPLTGVDTDIFMNHWNRRSSKRDVLEPNK